jgi:alpha-ketoglutarate-dependent 2,4-dichlorophenoxyacetate dioxygenase
MDERPNSHITSYLKPGISMMRVNPLPVTANAHTTTKYVKPPPFPLSINKKFQGNGLWHVDSSFNPRRASYSILLAHIIPPPGTGGETGFADTRTAFEDLTDDLKEELLSTDYVAAHSLFHSRKVGSPEFFAHVNPLDHKMARHKLVQKHEPSGRMNLYIAKHAHHIEGLSPEKSDELLERLIAHATQDKYTIEVPWHGVGDMVMWDNTCVMHRATGGSFEGRYARDMRRTTVHDASSTAWGLNDKGEVKQGFAA